LLQKVLKNFQFVEIQHKHRFFIAIFAHIDGTLGISPPHLTSMLIKCAIFPVLLQAFQIIFSYFLRAERPVCPSAPFR